LYPTDAGQKIDLTDDRDFSSTFADLVLIREEIAQRQLLESQLKQKIQQRMGDASNAIFETGNVSWKRSKDSQALDMAALLLDQPDLPMRYPLTKPGSRRFLITT
jgi:hypothetical protein